MGIYLHKAIESAVAVYGIMKAGASYVPVDPLSPVKRLESVLRDAGIRHLVSQDIKSSDIEQLASGRTPLQYVVGLSSTEISLETLPWSDVFTLPDSGSVTKSKPDDMAYLMYTSGTTGEPKGIIHTHSSGLSYALHAAATYGLDMNDRLSGFPPLHFDQSTFDYFSGPSAGATTVIIPEPYMRLPASLSQLIEDEKLTVWYSVPLALSNLLHHGALESRDLTSLRWVLFGGEPFPVKYLRELMLRWPHARFSNVYGPAEVNQVTIYNLPGPPETDAALPLGRIWDNAEGLVVDENNRPVVESGEGELAVSTPAMMNGYWNDAELSQMATFSATSAKTGEKTVFYRTGDVVRRCSDGTLVFVGRRDRQVKVRGYRVELDAIEAAILGFPSVETAAVFTIEADNNEWVVHATVTALPGKKLDKAALRQFLSEIIPRYAMPEHIQIVGELPLTTTGKVDHKVLQERRTQRA